MSEIIVTHYENSDMHHSIDFNGREDWCEYNKNNELIYHKDSLGDEFWYKDGNEIHYKSHDGGECWFKYDENNRVIHHKISDGRELFYKYKERVEYDQVKISKQEFQRMIDKKGEYSTVESRLEILDL